MILRKLILIFFTFSLCCQTSWGQESLDFDIDPCQNVLTKADNKSDSRNNNIISLWGEYDIKADSHYSVVITYSDTRNNKIGLINDTRIIQSLQEKFANVPIISNDSCFRLGNAEIILLKNKRFLERSEIMEECQMLSTICGAIHFDFDDISSAIAEFGFEIIHNEDLSQEALDTFLKSSKNDPNIFFINYSEDPFFGTMKFIFKNGAVHLEQLKNDDFYMKVVMDRIDHKVNVLPDNNVDYHKLDLDGKMLEELINRKVSRCDLSIINWEISAENPKDIVITANYTQQACEDYIKTIIEVQNNENTYSLILGQLRSN